jgi:hypothetical protein
MEKKKINAEKLERKKLYRKLDNNRGSPRGGRR